MINQEKALNLFHKQQEKNMVSHAYLIVGKRDAFSFAEYMAQSLMCQEQKIGACGTCPSCIRIKEKQHGDYRILGQDDASIKKEEILSLKDSFGQTNLERDGHKVYVIEDVENASISALNSILKFLEEPESDITAILTTSAPNRVLETIQSRCMMIQLEEPDKEILYKAALEQGLDALDAYVLAQTEANLETIIELSDSEVYHQVKDIAIEFIKMLDQKRVHESIVYLQHEGIKNKKLDKDNISLLFDILITMMTLNDNENIQSILLDMTMQDKVIYKGIFVAMKDRIRPGINVNLLIDQCGYEIIQNFKRSSL